MGYEEKIMSGDELKMKQGYAERDARLAETADAHEAELIRFAKAQNYRIYSTHKTPEQDAEAERIIAEHEAMVQAEQDSKDAEWTCDITAERREAWNTLVRKMIAEKRVPASQIQVRAEFELGFFFTDLKRAIARHAL